MQAPKPHVLIAGAGIGGAALALCLHRVGVEATVFESVREVRPLGVGINILPHSARILHDLGLERALRAEAVLTRELRFVSERGSVIWSELRGREAGYPWPQYSVHRGRLQATLLRAVVGRLGRERVLTGHHLAGFEQDDEGVEVAMIDKTSGAALGSFRGDVLVGADGIHSTVRAHLYPSEGDPVYHGLMLWRGATHAAPFLDGRTMVMAGHEALKAVVYPIGRARADGRAPINWIAERPVAVDGFRKEDWNRRADRADFAPHFGGWDFGWIDLPALFAGAEAVYEFPMVDRDPLPRWSFGRVTLLGDAAHPMRPNGSNGSSQAILDAEALARALAANPDPVDALERYQDARLAMTSALVMANRQTGPERVLQMAAERCDGTCRASCHCLPRAELEQVAASYKRLAGFDLETLTRRD